MNIKDTLLFRTAFPKKCPPSGTRGIRYSKTKGEFVMVNPDGTEHSIGMANRVSAQMDLFLREQALSSAQKASLLGRLGGLLVGTGAPDNDYGANGDVYCDRNTGALYLKAANVWGATSTPSSAEVYFVTELPDAGTGNNGDLAVIYEDGVISGLAVKSANTWSEVATNVTVPATQKRASEYGVIELVDHFVGGGVVTATSGVAGNLNWEFMQMVGSSGSFTPHVFSGTDFRIGVGRVGAGNTAGHAASLQLSNGTSSTNSFLLNALVRLTNFSMSFDFKCDTTGNFHLGISNNPASTADAPTRFVGIKALNGTSNFQFEATNGTPVTVDTGVAVDTAWHRFELKYNAANSKWQMKLDSGEVSELARTLTTDLTCTIAVWVKSISAAYTYLYLDRFHLYGEEPA